MAVYLIAHVAIHNRDAYTDYESGFLDIFMKMQRPKKIEEIWLMFGLVNMKDLKKNYQIKIGNQTLVPLRLQQKQKIQG